MLALGNVCAHQRLPGCPSYLQGLCRTARMGRFFLHTGGLRSEWERALAVNTRILLLEHVKDWASVSWGFPGRVPWGAGWSTYRQISQSDRQNVWSRISLVCRPTFSTGHHFTHDSLDVVALRCSLGRFSLAALHGFLNPRNVFWWKVLDWEWLM